MLWHRGGGGMWLRSPAVLTRLASARCARLAELACATVSLQRDAWPSSGQRECHQPRGRPQLVPTNRGAQELADVDSPAGSTHRRLDTVGKHHRRHLLELLQADPRPAVVAGEGTAGPAGHDLSPVALAP